ncbi:unnamed protein product [Paramecium sonneborni]|uniref:Uncharacterized protein n=1 Tax=Paramecium sonneborni TaxID=65129 RepID=A0A8S1NHI3_9CILI|nr:unnamed protein product [Paramecium sonneborni]
MQLIGEFQNKCISLTQESVTSLRKIMIKFLFLELADNTSLPAQTNKLLDPELKDYLVGLIPADHPKNTRFSNIFSQALKQFETLAEEDIESESNEESSSNNSNNNYSKDKLKKTHQYKNKKEVEAITNSTNDQTKNKDRGKKKKKKWRKKEKNQKREREKERKSNSPRESDNLSYSRNNSKSLNVFKIVQSMS